MQSYKFYKLAHVYVTIGHLTCVRKQYVEILLPHVFAFAKSPVRNHPPFSHPNCVRDIWAALYKD